MLNKKKKYFSVYRFFQKMFSFSFDMTSQRADEHTI